MNDKQPHKRVWPPWQVLLVLVSLLVLLPVLYFWITPSVQEQLRELDLKRAIPDEENAAIRYKELFERFHEGSRIMDEQDVIVEELLAIQKMERCFFPLVAGDHELPALSSDDSVFNKYLRAFRRWSELMENAIISDLAADRMEEAVDKVLALMRLGDHLRQQPDRICQLYTIGLVRDGHAVLMPAIVEGRITENDLARLASSYRQLEQDYMWRYKEALPIQALQIRYVNRKEVIPLFVDQWTRRDFYDKVDERLDSSFKHHVSKVQGHWILVALRRYKNQNGEWPRDLDRLAATRTAEPLRGILSQKAFVYRQVGDSFILYGLGVNGVDEHGKYVKSRNAGKPDDVPIWPIQNSPAYKEWQSGESFSKP